MAAAERVVVITAVRVGEIVTTALGVTELDGVRDESDETLMVDVAATVCIADSSGDAVELADGDCDVDPDWLGDSRGESLGRELALMDLLTAMERETLGDELGDDEMRTVDVSERVWTLAVREI